MEGLVDHCVPQSTADRTLGAIDDDRLHWRFLRFKSEPELSEHSLVDRGSRGVGALGNFRNGVPALGSRVNVSSKSKHPLRPVWFTMGCASHAENRHTKKSIDAQ